jgi:hypothetical protein
MYKLILTSGGIPSERRQRKRIVKVGEFPDILPKKRISRVLKPEKKWNIRAFSVSSKFVYKKLYF